MMRTLVQHLNVYLDTKSTKLRIGPRSSVVFFYVASCCMSTDCFACWERHSCSCEWHSCSFFISSLVFCTSGPSSTVFFCWSASFFSRSSMTSSLAWQLAVSLLRSFWRVATRFALELLCFVTDWPEPPSDPGPCQGSQRHRPSPSAPHSSSSSMIFPAISPY